MTLDGHGTLSHDEVKIMSGVLDMANKEAKDAMLDVDRFFMLDCDATLDGECMQAIMASGHSRIPVYVGGRQNVVGILIVKNIILVDPNSQTKVRDVSKFAIRRIPRVSKRLPLFELLHFFGQGRSHLALVCDDEGAGAEGGRPTYQPLEWSPIVGVISMEDVIEELIQDEIVDETDAWFYDRQETGAGAAPAAGGPPALAQQKSRTRAAPVNKAVVKNETVDLTAHLRKLTAPSVFAAPAATLMEMTKFSA